MNLYYTNFVQADYNINGKWIPVILHHEWAIDYNGNAYKLDEVNEDDIQEHRWKVLEEVSDI